MLYSVGTNEFTKAFLEKFDDVSPFELKNTLLDIADKSLQKGAISNVINVGRGNPNWVDISIRSAFALLQLAAVDLCTELNADSDIGMAIVPPQKGIAQKWQQWMQGRDGPAADFLGNAFEYMCGKYGQSTSSINDERDEKGEGWTMPLKERAWPDLKTAAEVDDYVTWSLLVGVLGCYYPSPPICLPLLRRCMQDYVRYILPGIQDDVDLDVFATEGCCASITYVFRTLHVNGILEKGDVVAVMTPIFAPYIEVVRDPNLGLVPLILQTTENTEWQLDATHLHDLEFGNEKGLPKILFMVNPTNPSSTCVRLSVLQALHGICLRRKKINKPLLIVSDVVYASIVDGQTSLLAIAPEFTLTVVSLSKYFGTTGWRLGATVIPDKNIIDSHMIANISKAAKEENIRRYSIIRSSKESSIKFIERMVLESRSTPNAHTAGLSTPQQILMCLFCLRHYINPDNMLAYQKLIQTDLNKRFTSLLLGLGCKNSNLPSHREVASAVKLVPDPTSHTNYYVLLNVVELTTSLYGPNAGDRAKASHPLYVVFKSAAKGVIALDGRGFGTKPHIMRVSLANASPTDCYRVGHRIRAVLEELSGSGD